MEEDKNINNKNEQNQNNQTNDDDTPIDQEETDIITECILEYMELIDKANNQEELEEIQNSKEVLALNQRMKIASESASKKIYDSTKNHREYIDNMDEKTKTNLREALSNLDRINEYLRSNPEDDDIDKTSNDGNKA